MDSYNKKKYSWLKLSVLLLLFIPVILLLFVSIKVSDSSPAVTTHQLVDTDAAVNARQLTLDLRGLLKSPEPEVRFNVSQQEISALIALASRAIPRLKGQASLSNLGLAGTATLHVPENPFGDYVNLRVGISPSNNGLHINKLAIGNLNISGDTAIGIARHALNLVLDNNSGDKFIGAIKTVAMDNERLSVTFTPIPDIKNRLSKLGDIRDEMQLLGNMDDMRRYYAKLCELDTIYDHSLPVPAMAYISPTFALAQQYSPDTHSAVEQNQAALLALGLFLGSDRFGNLVGDIASASTVNCRSEATNVVFRQRRDLVQHFFISSTMKILSDSHMSFAVGEYKEVLDTTSGGLSVSDIAGNMAGIRFAERLLDPARNPRKLQQLLADNSDETLIFPDISGMPPKLPRKQFEATYGNVEDPRYQAMLENIEQRLDHLAIYR